MWAAQRALVVLAGDIDGYCIDLYTDNTVVQHALLRGSLIVPELQEFAKQLLQYQLDHNIIVRVYRATTEENLVADALFRQCWGQYGADSSRIDRNDHMLEMGRFLELQQRCGSAASAFTIDACVHARNRRVRRYVARYDMADTECIAVNVLAYTFPPQDGLCEVVYCNPPWVLIAPLRRHFRLRRLRGVWLCLNSRESIGMVWCKRQYGNWREKGS
jgi:hypothetical protein